MSIAEDGGVCLAHRLLQCVLRSERRESRSHWGAHGGNEPSRTRSPGTRAVAQSSSTRSGTPDPFRQCPLRLIRPINPYRVQMCASSSPFPRAIRPAFEALSHSYFESHRFEGSADYPRFDHFLCSVCHMLQFRRHVARGKGQRLTETIYTVETPCIAYERAS